MVISQFESESEVIVRRSVCAVDESLNCQVLFQDFQYRLAFPLGSQSDDLEGDLDVLTSSRFRGVDDVQKVFYNQSTMKSGCREAEVCCSLRLLHERSKVWPTSSINMKSSTRRLTKQLEADTSGP